MYKYSECDTLLHLRAKFSLASLRDSKSVFVARWVVSIYNKRYASAAIERALHHRYRPPLAMCNRETRRQPSRERYGR